MFITFNGFEYVFPNQMYDRRKEKPGIYGWIITPNPNDIFFHLLQNLPHRAEETCNGMKTAYQHPIHMKTCHSGTEVNCSRTNHDDVIKWKHFPLYWSFVRGIYRSPVNSLHKGQ